MDDAGDDDDDDVNDDDSIIIIIIHVRMTNVQIRHPKRTADTDGFTTTIFISNDTIMLSSFTEMSFRLPEDCRYDVI
jgi:hypothetical protein